MNLATSPDAAAVASELVDGRYAVVRPIATGGMGDVFEATDLRRSRTVAVKVIRADLVGRSEVLERFRREAAVLAGIAHPNVVTLLGAGTCRRRGPYLITEQLHGRSLDGLLAARSEIGVAGAVHVLRVMCAALGEAHRTGFIHRDVKPGNIFVSQPHGGVESVKLIDFGIAAPASPQFGLAGHGVTLAGEILGSLGYVPPEQLEHASRADCRSDLYALGVVVLECLGRVCVDVGVRTTTNRLASAMLSGKDDVPEPLVRLLDALLAVDPAERPATAEEVLEQLDGAIGPLPVPRLLTYGAPRASREEPTRCEPATRRAVAVLDRRRTTPRAPYATPMTLRHGERMVRGRVEDVSTGGLLVVTEPGDFPQEPGSVVRFAVPSTGEVVTVPVEVRWMRSTPGRTAIGLAFEALPPGVEAAIARYVEWHVRWLVVSG